MRVIIHSSSKQIFDSENVEFVSVPGTSGSMGILPGHEPLISTLEVGEVKLKENGEEKIFVLNGGFVQIDGETIFILADEAELAEELVTQEIEEAIKMAEENKAGKLQSRDLIQLEKQIRYHKLRKKVARS